MKSTTGKSFGWTETEVIGMTLFLTAAEKFPKTWATNRICSGWKTFRAVILADMDWALKFLNAFQDEFFMLILMAKYLQRIKGSSKLLQNIFNETPRRITLGAFECK